MRLRAAWNKARRGGAIKMCLFWFKIYVYLTAPAQRWGMYWAIPMCGNFVI